MFESCRRALLAVCAAVLGACSTPTVLYQHDRLTPPLEVPPDLTRPQEQGDYAIPQIGRLMAEKLSLGDERAIRMRRDGRLRWLEFKGDSRWLWQRVHDFWIDEGVSIRWEDPRLGIMETRWISNPDSRYARDRYRVRVEPADEEGKVWMFLTHRGINEVFLDEEGETARVWGRDFNDPELEIEVMGRFLEFLGVSAERVQTLKQQAAAPQPAPRVQGQALHLPEAPSRAWISLGLALDRLGWKIEAAERAELTYQVRPPVEGVRAQMGHLWGEDKGASLVLRVRAGEEGSVVRVVDSPAWPAPMRRALLNRILPYLG